MIYIVTDSPSSTELKIFKKLKDNFKLKVELLNVHSRRINKMLFQNVENLIINRVFDRIKAFVIASISKNCINNVHTYLVTFNRVYLYEYLSKFNIPIPRYEIVFDLPDSSSITDIVSKNTITMTSIDIGLDGLVESFEGLLSIIEHRYYMSDKISKVNIIIPEVEKIYSCYIIGSKIVSEIDIDKNLINKIKDIVSCEVCCLRFGKQDSKLVLIDINPTPELSNELIEEFCKYIVEKFQLIR